MQQDISSVPPAMEAPKSNKGLVTGLAILVAVLFLTLIALAVYLVTRSAPTPSANTGITPTATATPITTIAPVAGENPTDNSIFYNGLYFKDGVVKSVRASLPKLEEPEEYGYNGLYAYSTGKTLKVYKFNGSKYVLVNEKSTGRTDEVGFQHAVNYGKDELVVYLAGFAKLNNTSTEDMDGTPIFQDDVYFAYGVYNLTSNTLTLKSEGQHLEALAPDEVQGMMTKLLAANPATKTVYTAEPNYDGLRNVSSLNLDTKKTTAYDLPVASSYLFTIKNDFSGMYYQTGITVDPSVVNFYNFSNKKTTKFLSTAGNDFVASFVKEKSDGSYTLVCGKFAKSTEVTANRCYYISPDKKFKFNETASSIGSVNKFDYVDGYGFILTTTKGDYLWNPEVDSKAFPKIAAL